MIARMNELKHKNIIITTYDDHTQTHRCSHYTQKVSNLGRTGGNCRGDCNMGWVPLHEVVESEEKQVVEKISTCY